MQKSYNIKKWIPILFLIVLLILFYLCNLQQYVSFSFIQEKHQLLKAIVAERFFLSLATFAIIYIITTATSFPIATFLTILGGYLFGPFISLVVVDISATLGATILFLAVETSFGELLREKAASWVKRMEKGFHQNAFSYLLFLRLVPLFPFWAVTLASGLLGLNLRTFFLGTLIGIIPGAFVYSLVGNGLGALFEQGQQPDLKIIFSPAIFWPLLGLALLSLLPIFYRKGKKNDENKES